MAGRFLSEKLLLKAENRVLLVNQPSDYTSILNPLPEGITFHTEAEGHFKAIHLFVQNKSSLKSELKRLISLMTQDTIIWIIYPKKSSKVSSDLHMNDTWAELAEFNLSPVASIAIDDTWTAIRLKHTALVKRTSIGNSAIRENELGNYIDVDRRIIHLPEYLSKALSRKALDFFSTLSYTNKKEYLVWILSAKQEKTRTDRIQKMEEKLIKGKKNPSAK